MMEPNHEIEFEQKSQFMAALGVLIETGRMFSCDPNRCKIGIHVADSEEAGVVEKRIVRAAADKLRPSAPDLETASVKWRCWDCGRLGAIEVPAGPAMMRAQTAMAAIENGHPLGYRLMISAGMPNRTSIVITGWQFVLMAAAKDFQFHVHHVDR